MTRPLTPQQERLWQYIRSCRRSPSYQEMADALGYKSKTTPYSIVQQLKRRGYLFSRPGSAHAVIAFDPGTDLSAVPTDRLRRELERRLAA